MSTPSSRFVRGTLPPWLAALLAALVGAGVPLQARVNGELGERLGDPVLTALISLVGGLVVLSLLALALPRMRQGVRRVPGAVRRRELRPGYLLAGSVGALFLLGQSVTVVVLGVAVFTVAVVAGQTIGGLLTDATGFGRHARRRPTTRRLLGAGLVVAAVAMSVSSSLGAGLSAATLLLPTLGVLLIGVLIAFQHAANARVGAAVRSPLAATVMNFLTGTSIVVAASLVGLVFSGTPAALPSQWWLYLGGVFGIVFIAGSAALIPYTGVLVLALGSIVGQLLVSLLLDVLAPVADSGVSPATVGGIVLALVAVTVASVPPRTRPGARLTRPA